MNKKALGSITAKGGFLNEKDIVSKFLNYKKDTIAQEWLKIMGYNIDRIEKIDALQIPPRISKKKALTLGLSSEKIEDTIKFKKADIQIQIKIIINKVAYIENISLKKANRDAGFNQVDKRAVDTYQKMWGFDNEVAKYLKLFTGEILPKEFFNKNEFKNKKRVFLNELPKEALYKIINFFEENKTIVISDILKGRGALSCEWFLVTRKDNDKIDWVLKDINYVCNFYAQGSVKLSPRGSLKIGRVTMQRKGGTPDPTSLQFKINPLELFNG